MFSRIIQLVIWAAISVLLGYMCYPFVSSRMFRNTGDQVASDLIAEERPQVENPKPARVEDTEIVEDLSDFDGDDESLVDSENDEAWKDDYGESAVDNLITAAEKDANSYMTHREAPEQQTYQVEDVPDDPTQMEIPGVYDRAHTGAVVREASRLAAAWEKAAERVEKGKETVLVREEFAPLQWKRPEEIYKTVTERIMVKLGTLDESVMLPFLSDPSNRLDLAIAGMIRLAGVDGIRRVAEQRMGTTVLNKLASELDWITGLMYSGPTSEMEKTLSNLAMIFSRYSDDINDPVVRRIATTTASEFAREHWSDKDMMARFAYYYSSYREGKLNVIFDTLRYWETRFVTGCREPESWGSPRSLAWQRDNVRLPVEGYLGACTQISYRLRNVAGDSVFSSAYLAPIAKYTNNTTAWAHREIGGVCGACSHYGAYGALAAGIPASAVGEPGHCAYTVRVGKDWRLSYSIYWEHGVHKTFWKEHDWDFLIMTQALYDDFYTTLVSDQLAALGEFLASRKKNTAALTCYQNAVLVQPLNWPAWLRYAGFLKEKAPDNLGKWKEANDMVTVGMGKTYYDAAATLLYKYIYPNLLPLMKEKKELNKLFDSFFKQCKTKGTNRWDLNPLLDAQISAYQTDAERKAYMKDSLRTLMSRPDYAGAVLSWGLDYVAKHATSLEEGNQLAEELSELLLREMGRARTSKKEADATWAMLGESIHTAEDNRDRRTFQAVGKLAYRKFKSRFPRKQKKFRAFPGRVVSTTGMLQTATTVDPGQMAQCVLHWGVLQRFGGLIPGKFEGESGVTLEMESACLINGVIVLSDANLDRSRAFYIQVSNDGQNWSSVPAGAHVEGPMIKVDLRKKNITARFVRLLREGDKYQPNITGFYVYGKPIRDQK